MAEIEDEEQKKQAKSATQSVIEKGKNLKEKEEKAEKLLKIIKTLLSKKVLIAFAIVLLLIAVTLIMVAGFDYILDLETEDESTSATTAAFSGNPLGGGSSGTITGSGDVAEMLEFGATAIGDDLSAAKARGVISSNFSEYSGSWCSVYVYSLYEHAGFIDYNEMQGYTNGEDISYASYWQVMGNERGEFYNGYLANQGDLANAVKFGDLSYLPEPGDLVLFYWNNSDNYASHVGMVYEIDGDIMYTLEGNTDDGICNKKERRYVSPGTELGYGKILGYFSLRKFLESKGMNLDSNNERRTNSAPILKVDDGKYNIYYKNSQDREFTGLDAIKERLREANFNFEDYNSRELECIYTAIKAEWATTLPNLGEDIDNTDIRNTDLQGVIKLKRETRGEDPIDMTFIEVQEFNEKVVNGDDSVLKNFTIKGTNLVVAYVSNNTINTKNIEYRSLIGIHALPFNFTLPLLISTEDPSFIKDVLNLAFNSEIVLTIYDNIIETTTTVETVHHWIDEQVISYDLETNEPIQVIQIPRESREVTESTVTTCSISHALTYVDSWFGKTENSSNYTTSEHIEGPQTTREYLEEGAYTDTTVTIVVKKYIYIPGTARVDRESIGKKFKEAYDRNSFARGNLTSTDEWLIETLEDSEITVDYVPIMKYLLTICTGRNWGVTIEDIESILMMYNTNSFSSIVSAGSQLELISEYIGTFEGHTPLNAEGDRYRVIQYEGESCLTVGRGVTIDYNRDKFAQAATELGINDNIDNYYAVGAYVDKEWVDRVKELIIQDRYNEVQERVPGLKPYQYAAIISQLYQSGSLNPDFYELVRQWTGDEYGNCSFAYKDWNVDDLLNADSYWGSPFFDSTLGQRFLSGWETTFSDSRIGLRKRWRSDFILFKSGWNMLTHTYWPLTDGESVNTDGLPRYNALIVEKAMWVKDACIRNSFDYHDVYSLGSGRRNHPVFNQDKTLTGNLNVGGISCASFVTETLCQAGLYRGGQTIWASQDIGWLISYFSGFGIAVQQVTAEEALPGDLLYIKPHAHATPHANILIEKMPTSFKKTGSPEFTGQSNDIYYSEAPISKLNDWYILRVVGSE